MKRSIVGFVLFLALAVAQTSLFASLPGLFAYTPLLLAVGVYLVQHVGERMGAYWIVGFGLFLDVLAIPSFPLETISYAAAAAAVSALSRHVFSNRSWYGLLACGVSGVLAMGVARAAVLLGVALRHPERVSWDAYADTLFWNVLLVGALLAALFSFARQIRGFLHVGFLTRRNRDTL